MTCSTRLAQSVSINELTTNSARSLQLQFDTDNYFPNEDSVFARPEAVIKVPQHKRNDNFHILLQITPYSYATSRGF